MPLDLKYTDLAHKHKPFLDPVSSWSSWFPSPFSSTARLLGRVMPTLCFISSHFIPFTHGLCRQSALDGACMTLLLNPVDCFLHCFLVANSIVDFLAFETFLLSANSTLDFPSTLWADFSFFLFWAFTLIVTCHFRLCLKVLSPILFVFSENILFTLNQLPEDW